MKSAFKILFTVLTVSALSSCKGVITITDDVTGEEVILGSEELSGSISYRNGGWWGVAPNYKANLKMEFVGDNLVRGYLDTPYCKVEGLVDIKLYAKLDYLMSTIPVDIDREISPLDRPMESQGDEVLSRSAQTKDNRLVSREYFYLREGDSSDGNLVFRSPEKLRYVLDEIIQDLSKDCGSTKDTYTSAEISLSDVHDESGKNIIGADLRLVVQGESLRIEGVVKIANPFNSCRLQVAQVLSSADLAKSLQSIELVEAERGCVSPNDSYPANSASRPPVSTDSGFIILSSETQVYQPAALSCEGLGKSGLYAKNSEALVLHLQKWIRSLNFTQSNCVYSY